MIGFTWMFLVFAMFAGSILPNPLGVPPLPEDPRLLGCAPASSLAYVQWFGTAEANPESPNHTEQLAAEPEVRAFVSAVVDSLAAALEVESRGDGAAKRLFEVASLALRRPGCAFVTADPDSPMTVGYGLVVNCGERIGEVATHVHEVIAAAQDPGTKRTIEGVEFHLVDAGGVEAGFAVHGEYLVFAYGPASMTATAGGLGSAHGLSENPRFAAAHDRVTVARPSVRTFVDLGALLALARDSDPTAAGMLADLGLDAATAYCAEAGFEAGGYVSRALLAARERQGLLALLDGEPLAASTLALVPADAQVAAVVRLDAARVWSLLFDVFRAIDPLEADQAESGIDRMFDQMFGLDLRGDILAHLGDEWAVWSRPSEGSVLMLGACACVTLDDPAAFAKSFDQILTRARAMLPSTEPDQWGRRPSGVTIETLEHAGTTIHWLNTIGEAVPIAPAFCVHGGKLWVATFPQVLKAAISRDPQAKTLADVAELVPGARAHAHVDLPSLLGTCYSPLLMMAQLAAAELQQDGVRIDVSAVPSLGALIRHLGVETSTLSVGDAGFLATTRGTLPRLDPGLAAALPLVGAAPYWMISKHHAMVHAAEPRAAEEAERPPAERR